MSNALRAAHRMSPSPDIRPGGSADLPRLLALLEREGLPIADLTSNARLEFWVLDASESFAGVVGLERFGADGLLRSLAVSPEFRRRGLGSRLVERLESDAHAEGVKRLVLLTETAEAFFRRRGYQRVDRSSVGAGLKESAEFRSLCPASAVCMSKVLEKSS